LELIRGFGLCAQAVMPEKSDAVPKSSEKQHGPSGKVIKNSSIDHGMENQQNEGVVKFFKK